MLKLGKTLSQAVNPEILYSNYLYKSGISQPYIEHCKDMYKFCNDILNISNKDKILDIGGNDGTLLKTFLNINSNYLFNDYALDHRHNIQPIQRTINKF